MKARLAKKIIGAQPEYAVKRTNPYWAGRWNIYNANMHPRFRKSEKTGRMGDHRIAKALVKRRKLIYYYWRILSEKL